VCLLVLAWQSHPHYSLILAANRDEFHDRPAAPLGPWTDAPHLMAGRDLRAGGTWLGVDRARRVGVITNYRELQRPRRGAPSRGELIPSFLAGERTAGDYLSELETDAPAYSGFNLLLAAADGLWYASNRSDTFARRLTAGVHGLANQELDAPSPKLVRVRHRFESTISRGNPIAPAELFAMLADRERASPEELPFSGLTPEWELALSSPFVVHSEYGTRCSTVLLLQHSGDLTITEHRFDSAGRSSGESEYRLNAAEWPRAA
jgi:uncharacterized protein with NRDE domain